MSTPAGKTRAVIVDARHERFNQGDAGWIDGYIRNEVGVLCAVFVSLKDGDIGLVAIDQLIAEENQ